MRGLTRRAAANAPFLVVVFVLAAAPVFLALEPGHWLRGAGIVALALALAAVFRAVLPPVRAGLLVVRGQAFDTVCYAVLAVAIGVVGVLLPK